MTTNNRRIVAAEIARIVALMGDERFVVRTQWYGGDDPVDGWNEGGSRIEVYTPSDLLREIDWDSFDEDPPFEDVQDTKSFIQFIETYIPIGDDCNVTLMTESSYREQERIKERTRHESVASELLRRHGIERITSFDAIRAIIADMNRLSQKQSEYFGYEQRAERFMDHRHSGSSHAFWENEDYARGVYDDQFEQLDGLLQYIQESFPLFWAEWEALPENEKGVDLDD